MARGEALCTIRYAAEARLDAALPQVAGAFRLGARARGAAPLVLETIG